VEGKKEKNWGQFHAIDIMTKSKISFQFIKQYSWFIWEATFSERMEASKGFDSPTIQKGGLTAYILRYMVIKKGVIKDAPEDMELENLTQQHNSDNQNKHPIAFQIIDAVRLKMRVKETNKETKEEKWIWKESRVVCLTFRIKELPPHIYFCNIKIDSAFVATVQQCYKRGKFGHISKFCMKEKECFSCEKAAHEGYCVKKCVNYDGNHRANSERCPVIKKAKGNKSWLIKMLDFWKHGKL
jgi:hypothetical protein